MEIVQVSVTLVCVYVHYFRATFSAQPAPTTNLLLITITPFSSLSVCRSCICVTFSHKYATFAEPECLQCSKVRTGKITFMMMSDRKQACNAPSNCYHVLVNLNNAYTHFLSEKARQISSGALFETTFVVDRAAAAITQGEFFVWYFIM